IGPPLQFYLDDGGLGGGNLHLKMGHSVFETVVGVDVIASSGHRDLGRALGKEIHLFAVEAVQRPRRRRGLPVFLLKRDARRERPPDRKSTRLNSSHLGISYAVF